MQRLWRCSAVTFAISWMIGPLVDTVTPPRHRKAPYISHVLDVGVDAVVRGWVNVSSVVVDVVLGNVGIGASPKYKCDVIFK